MARLVIDVSGDLRGRAKINLVFVPGSNQMLNDFVSTSSQRVVDYLHKNAPEFEVVWDAEIEEPEIKKDM